ncbi:MAG: DegT/DnrJ/EryC1/StrS family aminotransferase [Acidobacteriota bacterium]
MAQLAIAGGTPVRTKPFTAWPLFDEREQQGLLAVLESRNWGGYPFPNKYAKAFAERFAERHTARYALCAANGTVTIEIALKACGIRPGDEVIVPAYTFEATAVPVLKLGAIPVFVDVTSANYCLDVEAARAAITERTRAIIPVHLAMNMADMDAIKDLAHQHDLRVVEDCAHAHGARWRGQGAGSLGDAGSFSMQTSKLLTAGEGGVVTTNDDELFERCESYVNCGRASSTDRFKHRLLGYNYRMTEFQAAMLLAQLERLDAQTDVRAERAARLAQALAQIDGIEILKRDERQTTQAIYQYVFKYNAEAFGGASRNRFVAALEAEGVPCDGIFYEPMYRSALFKVDAADFLQLNAKKLAWQHAHCPVAERAAYEEAVWLPHQLLLGDETEVDDIVEAIVKIQNNPDELRKAEHRLIDIKAMNRAERPKFEDS